MLDRTKYFEEVSEVVKKNKHVDRKEFELLYKAATGEKIKVESSYLVEKIVKSLFDEGYKELTVPWKFFETEIGKALMKLKLEIFQNQLYKVEEESFILGFEREEGYKY